jgi:ribonuclease E
MSNNKMLIDATHPEETRVVVLRDNRVEEFDYESAARKLLRGSIYLAKITRVEPSLQAAFVDYGGNRHGFLAFSEIHPDYYQIPHADRQALLEEELAEQRRQQEADEREDEARAARTAQRAAAEADASDDSDDDLDANDEEDESEEVHAAADTSDDDDAGEDADQHLTDAIEATALDATAYLPPESASGDETEPGAAATAHDGIASDTRDEQDRAGFSDEPSAEPPTTIALDSDMVDDVRRSAPVDELDETHVHISAGNDTDNGEDGDDTEEVESFNENEDDEGDVEAVHEAPSSSDDDDEEESPRAKARSPRPRRRARQYKIQEVVKRRQIVLIQVVKEERGNKGAALTTYLSLAGRYTVLMPNTARGGGISRKITNVQDRKRLKAIAQELDVPEGMGLIIRTAGASRTKQEIKRDFEYLLRLWENVRSLTLESTAPSLVYEEGNLIKRSIRDLYTKDIEEVVVAGEEAFKEAKGFMKMLMPSHAKNVVLHTDDQSLFARYRIEQQLNAMFSPVVQLKSGGYLVINQTEALVAVDVNSGKSTREFSIEETALNTNLEAAEELSRQLKLRDLAGLIVVDFIDMDEKRNNRAVERKLKDCLRHDRARIQVGRISHFGLLEMSRQRLRTGVLEGSTMPCPHCQGSGMVRSTESVSLAVLRGLEDNFLAGKAHSCVTLCAPDVAFYLLNQKRAFIQDLERSYGVVVHVRASDKHQGANFAIETLSEDIERLVPTRRDAVNIDTGFEPRTADNDDQSEEEGGERPSRRRRRRGGRRDDERQARDRTTEAPEYELESDDEPAKVETAEADDNGDTDEQGGDAGERRSRRSRRRGRRGGRRHREQRAGLSGVAVPGADQPDIAGSEATPDTAEAASDRVQIEQDTPDREDHASTADAAPLADAPPADEVAREAVQSGADQIAEDRSAAESVEPAATDTAETSVAAHMEKLGPPPAAQADGEEMAEEPARSPVAPETTAVAAAEEPQSAEAPPKAEPGAPADEAEAPPVQAARAARSQPVASEPVLQRVVVGPNGATPQGETAEADEAEQPSDKPTRRGWWQRQFGG